MSTFEERKSEILRRSEERIRIRRGRKKIAFICAPLCLCAVVLSLTAYFSILSAKSPLGTDNDPAPETPVIRYEITDSAKLTYMLNEVFTANSTDETGQTVTEEPESTAYFTFGSAQIIICESQEEKRCEIVLQNGDSETVYELSGHTLTNLDTGEEVLLDDVQLNRILSMIGSEK